MRIYILWALTLFFTFDSVFRTVRYNFNLGAFFMYVITIGLWCYTLFNKQIDLFCSSGIGYAIKIMFFCACAFVAFMISFIILMGYSSSAKGNEKAIIVLGAGLQGENVSNLLARRLDVAYEHYLTNTDTVIVVSGGQGANEIIPEALAMYNYLINKGVPSHSIIIEDKSTSTEENFLFSKKLLAEKGITEEMHIAFATNHFHCYRARLYAYDAGFKSISTLSCPTGFFSFLPSYLREICAVLHYWVFKS